MRTITVDTDEAVSLNIVATANRTFELAVDLRRPIDSGETFKLKVAGGLKGETILTFLADDGLSLSDQSVILRKTHEQMQLSTGVFRFELIGTSAGKLVNLAKGTFTIKPAFT